MQTGRAGHTFHTFPLKSACACCAIKKGFNRRRGAPVLSRSTSPSIRTKKAFLYFLPGHKHNRRLQVQKRILLNLQPGAGGSRGISPDPSPYTPAAHPGHNPSGVWLQMKSPAVLPSLLPHCFRRKPRMILRPRSQTFPILYGAFTNS